MRTTLTLAPLVAAAWLGHVSASYAQSPELTVDALLGDESEELRTLRLAELGLFGEAVPDDQPERGDAPGAFVVRTPLEPAAAASGSTEDLTWMRTLAPPDLPVRWDEKVVEYLRFYRDDPRGRALMSAWLRRMGRYDAMVRRILREERVPEDLIYLSMAESGFDPNARSSVGAVGLWQFMAGTATEYGLERSHWIDERRAPEAATRAAARYLRDLHARLGTWELAFAAFNMGYGALSRAMQKYNSNDYWLLSRIEAGLPFETTLYVAKIIATAIVGRNPASFGYATLTADAPLDGDVVDVPGGTPLGIVARAAGSTESVVALLNPELIRRRTPPGQATTPVRIPTGSSGAFAQTWRRIRPRQPSHRPYVVRFGETLEMIAQRFRTTTRDLEAINGFEPSTRVMGGFAMMVPTVDEANVSLGDSPVVAVPETRFHYPGRRRVFYRIVEGDSLPEIASFFGVTVDELRRWNNIDPRATLQRGLLLQLFVTQTLDLTRAVVLSESDVRILVVGSEEFFEYHETQRGCVWQRYRVRDGDTFATIAARFGLSVGSLSRINRMGRSAVLTVGQEIVVYAPRESAQRDLGGDALEPRGEATVEEAGPAVEATTASHGSNAVPDERADAAPAEVPEPSAPANDGDGATEGMPAGDERVPEAD